MTVPALKILMVSETLPARQLGGLAKHAVTLANTLIDEGHEVTILGLAGQDDDASRREMGFQGTVIGALALMPGWKEGLLGCFNPFKRLYFARQMARTIAAHAPGFDVVHYHGNLPILAAFVPDHINFVQTRHDQGIECLVHVRFKEGQVCTSTDAADCAACATPFPNALQRMMSAQAVKTYRQLATQALRKHKTIFVSQAILGNAQRVLPASAFTRAQVVHNFIDEHRVAQAVDSSPTLSSTTSPPGNPQVIIASRLDDAKGVRQFLAEWQRVGHSGARLIVVGDGPLREAFESEYTSSEVTFLRHQPYTTTLQLTAQSQISVVPSQCEEACSTTILEALFLGLPCLALNRGGNPELARYQRWPGQLQLFDTIADLVAALRDRLALHPYAHPPTERTSWTNSDVRAQLPRILHVYEN